MKYSGNKKTTYQIITNSVTAIILALFVFYLIFTWKSIPDSVPTHFGVSGVPDAYGDKNILIVFPVIAVIIFAVLAIGECFPKYWNFPVKLTEENYERLMADGIEFIGIIKILLALFMCYIGYCSANCMPMSWPLYAILGAIVIVIIAEIIRMIKDR